MAKYVGVCRLVTGLDRRWTIDYNCGMGFHIYEPLKMRYIDESNTAEFEGCEARVAPDL